MKISILNSQISNLRSQFSNRGFTLVEVLIAITLSAVILGALSTTLDALVTTERSMDSTESNDRVARLFMDRLNRELIALPREADTPVLITIDNEMKDAIEFTTLAYGSPRQITISWKENVLTRDEIDPTLIDPSGEIRLPQISELGLRYNNGNAWTPDWKDQGVPASVAVQFKIGETRYGSIISL